MLSRSIQSSSFLCSACQSLKTHGKTLRNDLRSLSSQAPPGKTGRKLRSFKRQPPGDLGLLNPTPIYDAAIRDVVEDKERNIKSEITMWNEEPALLEKLVPPEQTYVPQKNLEKDPKVLLPLNKNQWNNLHRYRLVRRIVKQQTGKGKIARHYCLTVVGNGDGLVGYGEGKHDDAGYAAEKSFIEAVRNMDYVERFESRTVWTDMSTKLGGTRIRMRPRPVGFGLRCNPNIHQVLKAAGVKDVSAKVWGSRNPINVIKATVRMVSSGYALPMMGDGVGGGGKKLEKGAGMRSKDIVELERGRKLIDGRL